MNEPRYLQLGNPCFHNLLPPTYTYIFLWRLSTIQIGKSAYSFTKSKPRLPTPTVQDSERPIGHTRIQGRKHIRVNLI